MKNLAGSASTLMVVEDSDEDFEALSRILRKLPLEITILRCDNGETCLEELGFRQLGGPKRLPDLILLNLNLPGTDGCDALRAIKRDPRLHNIPVTVLTASSNPRDVETCYSYGANAYVLKSMDYDEWTATVRKVMEFWFGAAVPPAAAI